VVPMEPRMESRVMVTFTLQMATPTGMELNRKQKRLQSPMGMDSDITSMMVRLDKQDTETFELLESLRHRMTKSRELSSSPIIIIHSRSI